jgi:hypothetical protein
MELQLPAALSIAFLLTTLVTLILFHRTVAAATDPAMQRLAWPITIAAMVWLTLQGVVSMQGIYWKNPDALPPRIFLFGVLPALLFIAGTFATSAGRRFITTLPLSRLTWVHSVRIAVELLLWNLFLQGAVPQLMTFEGRNLDIIAGLTAPFVAIGIVKHWFTSRMLLIWNLICLALLINIVTIAVLSVPSPLQKLAFDQPNRAVLIFPFSLLPAYIVPMVLFSHLVAITRLIQGSGKR